MTEMPFEFTWCYEATDDEDEQCGVLVIGEPEDVPPLHLDLSNILSDKTITINPIEGANEANADNYHFELAFISGILADSQSIALASENWAISSVSNQSRDSIYLLWIGEAISLSPEEGMEIILTEVAALSSEKTITTDITINWQFEQGGINAIDIVEESIVEESRRLKSEGQNPPSNREPVNLGFTENLKLRLGKVKRLILKLIQTSNISSAFYLAQRDNKIPDQGGDYDENFTLTLNMVQSTGKSNIPLYVGFVNCNKVLNTYEEANSLQLRLTNTKLPDAADADLTFHYDSGNAQNSQLVVVLEVGEIASIPWALGTKDQVNNIAISIPGEQWTQNGTAEEIKVGDTVKALQWTFVPESADVVLQPQETMLIDLDNIITAHPTGEANLYLGYQYVSGYKDGQFVCQIEKAPLTFDTKVRMGTRNDELDGLLTVKDGISLDSPGDIQHGHGNLNFGSSTRQMINLYDQTYGIGIQSNTSYLRSDGHFAWYQGGSHSDTAFVPGDGGKTQMKLEDDQLSVAGRIKDKTGYVVPVGTIVPYAGSEPPEGWWICNGDSLDKNSANHQDLFDVIGYKYTRNDDGIQVDSGDNFNVPDLRGRVPVGLNDGTFNSLGDPGGEETNTLTKDQMPSHNHNISDPGHSHAVKIYDNDGNNNDYSHVQRAGRDQHGSMDSDSSFTNISINATGGGGSHNNLQPYLTRNSIIKG